MESSVLGESVNTSGASFFSRWLLDLTANLDRVGRYREDVIGPDGQVRRERKAIVLGAKREIPTKRLAERRMDVLLARINDYSYRPSRIATLEEFAERWKVEVLSKRKASTVHGYESHLKNHILPHLGKLRLDQLGVENLQSFVTRISGTVSRTTIRNILATLSSILATAKNWNYNCEGGNSNRLVFQEREVRPERKGFSPVQAAQIIAQSQGQFRLMIAIAAMTGLRVGEILGLQTSDFDFDNRVFHVRRSVWRGKLQTPKNANSIATLPLPDTLAKIVRKHIEAIQPGFLFLNNRGNLFIAGCHIGGRDPRRVQRRIGGLVGGEQRWNRRRCWIWWWWALPVRPGRDLARLIEVAAFQTKLKSSGYNPAKELNDRLISRMAAAAKL
jgi:integrase